MSETALDHEVGSALMGRDYGRPLMRGKLVKEPRGILLGKFPAGNGEQLSIRTLIGRQNRMVSK